MTDTQFKYFVRTLYAIGFTFVAIVALLALPYYLADVSQRPHSNMHVYFKPGGSWGHGLGIVGSAMVLMLFLYSARKRNKFGLRFGRINRWLDIHIFFGVMGPLLITLHTAMKFHGLVSISYFSMVAVVISGIFGRYVYMKIPRDNRGIALSLDDIQERYRNVGDTLGTDYQLSAGTQAHILSVMPAVSTAAMSTFAMLMRTVVNDIKLPFQKMRLRHYLKRREAAVSPEVVNEIVALAKERYVLERRLVSLGFMRRILHLWHVFHKPFAYIMIIIMFVHIAVTVSFGYRWVF